MGLLDKLFGRKKKDTKEQIIYENSKEDVSITNNEIDFETNKLGLVSTNKIHINGDAFDALKQRYIAFDVETTGLSPYNNRIIEVGAVLFEKGIPVKKYGTLINANVNISSAASSVNHITNQMIKDAPSEIEVYTNLIDFLGDALQEKTVICAHNAKFDMDFLSETFKRLGYNAKICYVDTLSLSRSLVKGLANYKQDTVANYFNLYNSDAHRAESDAEICGSILWKLLEIMEKEREKNRPSKEEMEVCAVIHNMIASREGRTDLLSFYKNSSGYVDVCYYYDFIKFKFAKKGKYIIVEKNIKGIENYIKEPCTMSEGGADFIRLFFNSPLDLEVLEDYIFEKYNERHTYIENYLGYRSRYVDEYKNGVIMKNALSTNEVKQILSTVHNKDYHNQNAIKNVDGLIDRETIEITPINNRVPISEIMNLDNWDKGYDNGYPFWEKGEECRKAGNIEEAIDLFDKARFYGYCAPALFESYSMAFHKIKDYDNEIDILDEGIEREGNKGINISSMIIKRNNAMKMLVKQREKEKNSRLKEEKKELEKINSDLEKDKPIPKRTGRPIMQMDDDMNIIEQFETVAEAVRKTGINSKSIRSAAKGIQKHAGGFVWRYVDELETE